METPYPVFTDEMKKTHKILIPNMAPVQFRMLAAAMENHGYQVELLGNCGSEVSELGLRYVHNDTCYPALLVIGQFLDALRSGKYDLEHTALIITQTGGGCRASNYIFLLRKALARAGYENIPVLSLNFSGLEKGNSLPVDLSFLRMVFAAVYYGDLLVTLRAQTAPYEIHSGDSAALQEKWLDFICERIRKGKSYSQRAMKSLMPRIAAEFAQIPVRRTPKVKVGVVGEIYVKYSPLGNNDLENFLAAQDCEVNLPGLMGFVQYCVYNPAETARLYGGSFLERVAPELILRYIEQMEKVMIRVLRTNGYHAPLPFRELVHLADGLISTGDKMGEGWLLTAEMVELIRSGYENIICAQPFGCLPNHICGKGMINKIRELYPEANITPIDYDPSATRVNQENRIKLMLAVGREKLMERSRMAADSTGETVNVTGKNPVFSETAVNVEERAVNVAGTAANVAGEVVNVAGKVANVATGGMAVITETAANVAERAVNVAGTAANVAGKVVNVAEKNAVIAETAATITGGVAVITETAANVAERAVNVAEKAANVAETAANVAGSVAGGTRTEDNATYSPA